MLLFILIAVHSILIPTVASETDNTTTIATVTDASTTTIPQDGTESYYYNPYILNTQTHPQSAALIQIAVISGCCIFMFMSICTCITWKEHTKVKKMQKAFSKKALTQFHFGNATIMHYTENGTITISIPHPPYENVFYESEANHSDNNIEEKNNVLKLKSIIKPLYHEKQKWELCLLHALNSLLQREEFTHKSLDNICKMLAPNKIINPHKALLGTGNYDANVLMMALSNINIDIQWYDARKANELDLNNPLFLEPDISMEFVGFILNNPQKAIFGVIARRHWLAIKRINGQFYNLDSLLLEPKKYDSIKELNDFLKDVLITNNAELMICRRKKSY